MATAYDNKYLAVLGGNIKSQNAGGRLFTGIFNKDLPNGVIGNMGATVVGKEEIKDFKLPTTDTIKNGDALYMVMTPEIFKDTRYHENMALGKFVNKANKPFPLVPLEVRDRIRLSEDYFNATGKGSAVAQGDTFVLTTDGLFKYSASASASDNKYKFVVTEVEVSHIANYVYSDGNRFPAPYKIFTVEMVLA